MKKYTMDRTCSDLARQVCETAPVPADKSGAHMGNADIREEEAGGFVNPLSDAGFKILFEKSGVAENAVGLKEGELLRDMLNAFFDERIDPIDKVRFKNTELFGETVNQRKTVFDVYFVDGTERDFVVEMQDERDEFMVNRVHNYMCRAHSNALEKGKKFRHRQAPVIGVVIANFYMHQQKEMPCISVIENVELKAGVVAIDLTKLVTVELPKFNKKIEDLKDKKDVYLFLLKNMGKLKEVPPQFDNDDYRPIFEIARIANLNPKDKMMYDKERIYATKWQHVVESAVNEKTKKIVENQLEEGSLSTAQIARFCELEIEDVEEINDALKQERVGR